MASGPYHITDDEHGPYVVVLTAVLMTYMILCYCARLLTRFTINGPLGPDDWTITAGSIVAVIQSALKISEAKHGLGKRTLVVSKGNIETIGKLAFAGDILYIFSMTLSRAASFLLIARLTRQTKYNRAARAGVALSVAIGFVSVFIINLRCSYKPWIIVPKCAETIIRWYIVEGLGVLVELIASWLPIYMIWSLKMRLKTKLVVFFAFSSRIPVVAITIVRLHFLRREASRNDPLFYGADSSVCLEVALHYGLIAATIPCLKPFVKAFNTGWFDTRAVDGLSYPEGYALSNLHRSTKYSANAEVGNPVGRGVTIHSPEDGRVASRGRDSPSTLGSDTMIIRRTTAWDVSYEDYK
ncbi:hypothetical protein LOZ58_005782 [Ophidiomyces ophidiicola]|nr:hypothetical protein LOZ65_001267 [Ophidiomyces ophidiicola]KAI1957412.1 hypothetical protein LOZ58_005782 [Ophidiomyces ophidiicola]